MNQINDALYSVHQVQAERRGRSALPYYVFRARLPETYETDLTRLLLPSAKDTLTVQVNHSLPFTLGLLCITPDAWDSLPADELLNGVRRHAAGDWGAVSPDKWQENDLTIRDGGKLLSVYETISGQKFWVATTTDRTPTSVTLGFPLPAELAFGFLDGQIFDAGVTGLHIAECIELPVLVAVGAKLLAAVVMKFILETHGDAVAAERPEFFLQAIVQLAIPFAAQKLDDLRAAIHELRAVAPVRVQGVLRLRLKNRDSIWSGGHAWSLKTVIVCVDEPQLANWYSAFRSGFRSRATIWQCSAKVTARFSL